MVIKKEKKIEESLWDSANKLRGSIEPAEYKHVVLSLIFLKFVSDKFLNRGEFEIFSQKASAKVLPLKPSGGD